MKRANFLASNCRFCRFYNPEGRRGGLCQRLNVQVESNWEACTLSSLPFETAWDNLEEIIYLEHSLALDCSDAHSNLETKEVSVPPLKQQEQKSSVPRLAKEERPCGFSILQGTRSDTGQ